MNQETLTRDELLKKFYEKKNQLRNNNLKYSKKQMKKTYDIIKSETSNDIINENIITYYMTLTTKKNKFELFKPSEIIKKNTSEEILTSEILELYYLSRLNYNNIYVPLPNEIFTNKTMYIEFFNSFITSMLDKSSNKINKDNIISNIYCKYLSKCLNININDII